MEHPQHDFHYRRWRADIGLTCEDNLGVHVALRIFHGLEASHHNIGPASSPSLSAPRLVQDFLMHPRWQACLGTLSLRVFPSTPESGKQLWDVLRDAERCGPVVVLAADEDGKYPINASTLSRQLSGVAAVWKLPYELQQEFVSPYFAGKTHYCQPGAIRVYQTEVKAGSDADGRHRYLPVKFIEEQGPGQVLPLLVQALIRQTYYRDPSVLFSPVDLEQLQRTERLEQLRQQLEHSTSVEHLSAEEQEYIALLEQENQQLTQQLQQRRRDSNSEELSLLERNELLEERNNLISSAWKLILNVSKPVARQRLQFN